MARYRAVSHDANKSRRYRRPPIEISDTFKIIISQALQDQKITSSDSRPLEGHCRSQVCSCSVAKWRTSFGRHIRLEVRYCAHLPDRFRRSPATNDNFDLSRWNLTFERDLDLRSNIDLDIFRSTCMFQRVSMRGTRWWHNYFDIFSVQKLLAKTRFFTNGYFDISWPPEPYLLELINSDDTLAKEQIKSYGLFFPQRIIVSEIMAHFGRDLAFCNLIWQFFFCNLAIWWPLATSLLTWATIWKQ